MAPAARSARALISEAEMPRSEPRTAQLARRALVIMPARTLVVLPLGRKTVWSGVLGDAWCVRKCSTRRRTALSGEMKASSVSPWVRASPFSPFFCVVKQRWTRSAASSSAWVTMLPLTAERVD